MKKVSITVRVPIFVDIDLEMEDSDYDKLVEEWSHTNFGLVRNLVSEYVDLDSVDLINAQERYGDPEIVDLRMFEDIIEPEEPEEPEEDDGIRYTSVTPKGKPN
jgi:hypothetical protein